METYYVIARNEHEARIQVTRGDWYPQANMAWVELAHSPQVDPTDTVYGVSTTMVAFEVR